VNRSAVSSEFPYDETVDGRSYYSNRGLQQTAAQQARADLRVRIQRGWAESGIVPSARAVRVRWRVVIPELGAHPWLQVWYDVRCVWGVVTYQTAVIL
jgi:hypothetical protein